MKRLTDWITWNRIARVLTPAAMVAFLTMEITNSQDVSGAWLTIVPVAAAFSSIGIEAWGIIAGKNLVQAWRVGMSQWATAAQLVLYVGVAVFLLWNNPTLAALPIVAALVYVAVAMSESLDTAVNQQEEVTAAKQDYDLERQREDDNHRRQMEARQAEMNAANELQIRLAREQASIEKLRIRRESQHNASIEQIMPASTMTEPTQSEYQCEDCQQQFATVQALNAHGRWCKARISANGANHG